MTKYFLLTDDEMKLFAGIGVALLEFRGQDTLSQHSSQPSFSHFPPFLPLLYELAATFTLERGSLYI